MSSIFHLFPALLHMDVSLTIPFFCSFLFVLEYMTYLSYHVQEHTSITRPFTKGAGNSLRWPAAPTPFILFICFYWISLCIQDPDTIYHILIFSLPGSNYTHIHICNLSSFYHLTSSKRTPPYSHKSFFISSMSNSPSCHSE